MYQMKMDVNWFSILSIHFLKCYAPYICISKHIQFDLNL